MAVKIEDNAGGSWGLKVTENNQALVQAEIHELQHHVSMYHGQVYQAIGEVTDLVSGVNTLLHISNNSTTLKAVVSYMRLQIPGPAGDGSTTLPDNGTYFQIGKDTVFSSGGVAVTPVNMNFSSGNVADLSIYKESPVVSGSFLEFDKWYPDHGMHTFNKHGSLVLGLNDTMEVRLVTDNAALTKAYCRITIMLKKNGDT